jgi:hypothetical protein
MKRWIVLGVVLMLACQRMPYGPNPAATSDPAVAIEHVSTEYVNATQPTTGILADKANVLVFRLRLSNISAKAVEMLGYATLEGPPDNHQQIVHFWTDSVNVLPQGTGFEMNTLHQLQSDSSYLLVRAKFPTNDYFPFSGVQGKIKQLEWTEAWACDETGKRVPIKIDPR